MVVSTKYFSIDQLSAVIHLSRQSDFRQWFGQWIEKESKKHGSVPPVIKVSDIPEKHRAIAKMLLASDTGAEQKANKAEKSKKNRRIRQKKVRGKKRKSVQIRTLMHQPQIIPTQQYTSPKTVTDPHLHLPLEKNIYHQFAVAVNADKDPKQIREILNDNPELNCDNYGPYIWKTVIANIQNCKKEEVFVKELAVVKTLLQSKRFNPEYSIFRPPYLPENFTPVEFNILDMAQYSKQENEFWYESNPWMAEKYQRLSDLLESYGVRRSIPLETFPEYNRNDPLAWGRLKKAI